MNCATHNDTAAVAFCRTCGKPLCNQCTRDVRGVIYCEACLAARMEGRRSGCGIRAAEARKSALKSATPDVSSYGSRPGPRPPMNSGPNPALPGFSPDSFPFGVGAVYTGQYAKGFHTWSSWCC